jgi:hypothetical protein
MSVPGAHTANAVRYTKSNSIATCVELELDHYVQLARGALRGPLLGVHQLYSFASIAILHTVRQLRSVIETPSNRSAFAASLDLPMPSGACK